MKRYVLIIMVVLCVASSAADGKGKLAAALGKMSNDDLAALVTTIFVVVSTAAIWGSCSVFDHFVEMETIPGVMPIATTHVLSWRNGSPIDRLRSWMDRPAGRNAIVGYDVSTRLHDGFGLLPKDTQVIIRGRDAAEPRYVLAAVDTILADGAYKVLVKEGWGVGDVVRVAHFDEPYLKTSWQIGDSSHIGSVVHLPKSRAPSGHYNCCDGKQVIFHIPPGTPVSEYYMPSHNEDIAYLEGKILTVYSNGMVAIGLDAKFDADGNRELYDDGNELLYMLTNLQQ